MPKRILTVVLAVALVVLAAYFLALQQSVTHEVDLRADETMAPPHDALVFAEFRWYVNQLENLAIEGHAQGVDLSLIRDVMHDALDRMWDIARSDSTETRRCDLIQCNPRLCAPWCPKDESDGGE